MKKTNKKLLLALGTLTTVAAPVAAVVSCGSETGSVRHFNLLPTYTGQADQLIALGIQADYYPLQLNTKAPFDYLPNAGKYMTEQSDDFKTKFQSSLDYIMPKTQGVSWWNQDAKASDDSRVSNTYWQDQKGSVLLYEHYLLDDDQKVVEESWAPKHTAKVTAETNFRASRDPYTRLPKGVFFGWDLSNETLEAIAAGGSAAVTPTVLKDDHDESKYVATEGGEAAATEVSGTTADSITVSLNQGLTFKGEAATNSYKSSMDGVAIDQASAKIIIAMRKKRAEFLSNTDADTKGQSDWFYNDWFFADSFHRMFLDNKDFQKSNFVNWMIDSTTTSPFTTSNDDKKADAEIKSLFDASTFTENEVANGVDPSSRNAVVTPASATASPHHPIYEQQEGSVGAAPMFEGAMRDNQLYLFNVAWQVSNLAKYGTPYGEEYKNSLPQESPANSNSQTADSKDSANAVVQYIKNHVTGAQYEEMTKALDNADTITGQLRTRMAAMKSYFGALGINGKKFGMMTVAPGKGVSTIQTISKYSFIYKELGFAQPMPSNLDHMAKGADAYLAGWKGLAVKTTDDDGKTIDPTVDQPNLNEDGEVIQDGKKAEANYANAEAETIANAVGSDSLFNMDDNGWFWTLGESAHLDATKLDLFEGQFDMGVIAARDANYEADVKGNDTNHKATAALFADGQKDHIDSTDLAAGGARVNYDLWNEGIKTPFVMQMVLDQIMTVAKKYADDNASTTTGVKATTDAGAIAKEAEAKNWGTYFTDTFTKNVEGKI